MSVLLAVLLALALLALAAVLVVLVVVLRRSRAGATHRSQHAGPRDPFSPANETAGDPRTLKAGDMVDYLGQRLFLRGSLRLREGGYTWSEHFLDEGGEGAKRWISVEEDPALEVVLWTALGDDSLLPNESTIVMGDVTYRRVEHGTATYTCEGTTGLPDRGRVEYVDYEADHETATRGTGARYLSFERFDGAGWEAGLGEVIPNGTLTIYPGS